MKRKKESWITIESDDHLIGRNHEMTFPNDELEKSNFRPLEAQYLSTTTWIILLYKYRQN
jgi:hypothetical protein